MRLLVISDTHGRYELIDRVLRREKEAKEVGKEVALEQWRTALMRIYKQPIDTTRLPRVPLGAVDTAFFRLVGSEVKYFPPPDTLSYDLDTMVLRAPVDTVKCL